MNKKRWMILAEIPFFAIVLGGLAWMFSCMDPAPPVRAFIPVGIVLAYGTAARFAKAR